jgi:hypothetical protein
MRTEEGSYDGLEMCDLRWSNSFSLRRKENALYFLPYCNGTVRRSSPVLSEGKTEPP